MFRRFILAHPHLAAALIALAMVMKIVVPGGFMPVMDTGKLVIIVCSGMGGERAVVIDAPGAPAPKQDGATRNAAQPCSFAGLAQPMLGGADPALLVAALVFILALGFAALVAPRLIRARHSWPPLRGPPLSA